ncbi:MAG: FKBP-type peptidyl-prolyl cis-trans isomerase [Ktedonobacteraceae bacterium]
MTQTMNGNKNTGNSQKLRNPGQRQQNRLQRQARRRRRQRIWLSSIVSVAIIILAVLGVLEYQNYTSAQQAKQAASAHAAATRAASLHATATAAAMNACLSKLNLPPTATAGPAKPPTVSGTPVTLADGLQYIDLQVGCGPAAKSGNGVSVEYTGWLQSSGKKFDSSYDRSGNPLSLQLGQGQVIKGFDEGLVGMQQGGIRRLIIPAALAYGSAGSPPTIPPNSVLIFDVQMIQVKQ